MTQYVVLTKANGSGWAELERVEAANDLDAIRKVVNSETSEGTFVAVPSRSFRVRRAATKTVVSFAEVTG